MPKIDPKDVPLGKGTRYPAPYDEPCKKREWKALGIAGGLTQFGVNLLTLKPGVWSSQRHWHAKEDEFAHVLSGEVVLVEDEGETVLRVGDSAAWKAGAKNGHHLKNVSDKDALILIVGSRAEDDHGEYSDIDMKFGGARYTGGGTYTRKDGSAI